MSSRLIRSFLALVACFAVQGVHGASGDRLEIVVFGATGKIGSHIVTEALDRGHHVTAVSRDPSQITLQHDDLTVAKGNLLDEKSIAELVQGKDVVIVSVRGVIGDSTSPEKALQYVAAERLVDVLMSIGPDAPRLIHVGGSGTLEVAPGVIFAARIPRIVIPKSLEVEIEGQILALEFFRKVTEVDWTYATPPKNLTNGKRTGVFRIGGDRALLDDKGRCRVSRADFAVALIDEVESGQHVRERFSVAY